VKTRVLLSAAASLLALAALRMPAPAPGPISRQTMLEAAGLMQTALQQVRRHRLAPGEAAEPERPGSPDPLGFEAEDHYRSGLIGPIWGPLMTTAGSASAKRTTLQPGMAALLAQLLVEAGARRGEPIAVGASGSFPGLLVATLAAARVLELKPVVILSLGASSYGLTTEAFTLLDLYDRLAQGGLAPPMPAAITWGGSEDLGGQLDPLLRERLHARITRRGIPLIEEADLARNLSHRLAAYQRGAGGAPPAVFVSIGGPWAALGTSPRILEIEPGLVRSMPQVPPDRQGMLSLMAERGVPVIHLLNIRTLAARGGLPWDPPGGPGDTPPPVVLPRTGPSRGRLAAVAIGYGVLLALIALWPAKMQGTLRNGPAAA
jgi:poly-gamma-glutamate system protein